MGIVELWLEAGNVQLQTCMLSGHTDCSSLQQTTFDIFCV